MKNKYLILLIIFALVFTLASCSKDEEITVFADGQTDYSFVITDGASEDEQKLVNSLAELSGNTAAVKTDASAEEKREILIGFTNRGTTDEIFAKLKENASALMFNFVIAESDGKIVILADAEIGYYYALDYLKSNYISDGKFTIKSDTYDVQSVFWDDYHSTDEYYNRLIAELEKENNNGNNGNGGDIGNIEDDELMTVAQAIANYKNLLVNFDTTKLGTYTSKTFINANKYDVPSVYPDKGEHPRILFTENTVDDVRDNLLHQENIGAYKQYMRFSELSWDGKFPEATGSPATNYDSGKVAIIEAKAFRYAMTGEKIYGYEALYAALNAINTINVSDQVSNYCRTYGYLMYVAACTYDWCYDLMADLDNVKEYFIRGCVNILGAKQEIVWQGGSGNLAPTAQGAAYAHGAEDQILVDYLSFAIACFDEAPEIYELVAGRILDEYVELQNYIGQSGNFWEGTMYGSCRGVSSMVAHLLINKMTDGAASPFDYLQAAITASTYYIRPDGMAYIIGDTNHDISNVASFQYHWMAYNCFYAGNLYGDTYLKSVAYQYLNKFTSFSNMVAGMSSVQFLAVNDPSVSHVHDGEIPLTYTATYPYTNVFTRSKNNDKDAFGLFMTMNEMYAASHMHAECGSFQLFYKGTLIGESGAYKYSDHYYAYAISSIAANTVMVYNQDLAKQWLTQRPSYVQAAYDKLVRYSGGQIIAAGGPATLSGFMSHRQLGQRQSLGTKSVEKNGELVYSYLGGDMTDAYDRETVDEVSRYMIAVATGDEKCPYAFLTFDRITSDDASYHKAALIHVQQEPAVTEDGFVIVTNTKGKNNGKLVLQNVGYDTDYVVWGGEGREFWIPGFDENGYSLEKGYNASLNASDVPKDGSLAEYGWGRVEISPAEGTEQKTNHILTVMYVTDADNNSENVKAKNLCTDTLSGTEIFGKAVFFPKDEKLLSSAASFTLDASADTCYVAGVKAGTWTVTKDGAVIDTITVGAGRTIDGNYADGEHIITFAATDAGTYTITPAN